MICTPAFIKVYNETFKCLFELGGKECVECYWRRIAPIALADLDRCFGSVSLEGCNPTGLAQAREYWNRVLTAEKAVFFIESVTSYQRTPFSSAKPFVDELTLNIYECPSLKILGDNAYEHYCDHCTVMYEPIFEKYGYDYKVERKEKGCRIRITKKKSALSGTEVTPVPASM